MDKDTQNKCTRIILPSIAMFFNFILFILASVYQFWLFGFAYSVIMIFASAIYLYQGIQYRRLKKIIAQKDDQPLSARNMSASSRALMSIQLKNEETRTSCTSKCLFAVYIFFLTFAFIIFVTRFISLTAHGKARKEITTFPSECSSWVPTEGCCYITMDKCARESEILKGNYTIAFDDTVTAHKINEQIETCARDMALGKLQSPNKLSDETDYQPLIHITFTSAVFGFIDDMFIETYQDTTYHKSVVNIMSQLRVGQNDLGVNTNHVVKMLRCLDDDLQPSIYDPCTDWKISNDDDLLVE